MLRLTKHHGLGNDFLVLLDRAQPDGGAVDPVVLPALARALCDRRRGIGADGLIVGARPDADDAAHGVQVVMHLHNADGSRAEMSGNGVRCLGQAVADLDGVTDGTVVVRTDGGVRRLVLHPGAHPAEVQVEVAMGAARPGPEVPADVATALGAARHATVDMGNPHLVIEVGDPDGVDLAAEGPALEQAFVHGVNVEFIAARPDGSLRLVVWERGAGVTEACGTGACAAVAAAHGWGVIGSRTTVHMPGGDAEVVLDADGVTLVGPSVRIAGIDVDPSAFGLTVGAGTGS